MANMTNYLKNKIVNGILGVEAYTLPTEVYLALFTADPTDVGLVTNEISNAEYDRKPLAGKFDLITDDSGLSITNASIFFAEAVTSWSTITHIGIMLSSVKGTSDMILFGSLTTSKEILTGKTLEVPAGFLSLAGA